jgi:hypothetical protein
VAGSEESDVLPVSFVVPIRASEPDLELAAHLRGLVDQVDDVIVVDGSDAGVFDRHRQALPPATRHLRPEVSTPMGKVGGVVTGLREARHDIVVVADDDVRWTRELLSRAIAGLGDAQVARPQNLFDPAPWHARWDTGRILVNRAVGGDWPGTMVVRASALPEGYAGDAMFENLELVRTVKARGGRAKLLLDVVVPRRPPSAARFWEQRTRQAYDELARPWRLVPQLALLPVVLRWRVPAIAMLGASAVAVAEVGRRRAGGRDHWGPTAPLWAMAWLAERSLTSWLAVGARLRGGIRYRRARLATAAHGRRSLRP